MTNTFLELLKTEINSIRIDDKTVFKEVSRYNSQTNYIGSETLKLPAILIEFKPIKWQLLRTGLKIGDLNFSLHIIIDSIKHAAIRETIGDLLHAKLDGLRGEYFHPVDCTEDIPDNNHAMLIEDILNFSTTLEHAFAPRTITTIPRPTLQIGDASFTSTPTVNLAKVLRTNGDLVQALQQGEWFYIPKHNIKKPNGDILETKDFDQDTIIQPSHVNNSEGIQIAELETGASFNIPKHKIFNYFGGLVASLESYEDYTIPLAPVPDWSPQPDWEPIDNVLDNQINLLIGDFSLATVSFIVTTQGNAPYTVTWGDNIVESFASNTRCQHTYAKGTGKSCARGYTTFKCTISSAANLLTFKIQKHSLMNQYQYQPFLYCVIGAKDMTSLANAFYEISGFVQCTAFEACIMPNKMNSLTSMATAFACIGSSFASSSFQYIKLPTEMNLLDTMSSCFYQTIIRNIIFPTNLPKLTSLASALMYCKGLKIVILPTSAPLLYNIAQLLYEAATPTILIFPTDMPALAIATSASIKSHSDITFNAPVLTNYYQAFDLGYSDTITLLPNLSGVTNLSIAFFRNYRLKYVVNHETLGSTTLPVSGDRMFEQCELIDNLSLNACFSSFHANGASVSIRNKLSNLRLLNKNSPYSGATPQINLNYTSFANSGLEQVFDDIPSNRYGKAISITGCIANVSQISKSGCTTTLGSTTVLCSDTSNLVVGFEVTSPNISSAVPVVLDAALNTINFSDITIGNNKIVSLASISGTTGITTYTPYYVVNSTGNSCQISLTLGGEPIDFTTNGTGTILYATYITSINPNVSFNIDIPAYLTGSTTMVAALLKRSKATLKGWSVTN